MLFLNHIIILGLAASSTIPAMAKPTEFQIADNIKTEVCISREEPIESKGCLVEIRKDKSSSFFARPDEAELLRLNDFFSKRPFVLEEVNESEYATLQAQTESTENLRTYAGGAILGGLQGASFGPVGTGHRTYWRRPNRRGRPLVAAVATAVRDGAAEHTLPNLHRVVDQIQ